MKTDRMFVILLAYLTTYLMWNAAMEVSEGAWRYITSAVYFLTIAAIYGYVVWTTETRSGTTAGTVSARLADATRRARERK